MIEYIIVGSILLILGVPSILLGYQQSYKEDIGLKK
jgi:hypothetical protein